MKRVRPDIKESIIREYMGNLKSVRKLNRLWGEEIAGGNTVLTHRQYYHSNDLRSENFEKLFKFIGAYEDVVAGNYKGIRSAWFYFNKNKEAEIPEADLVDFIVENLNKVFWNPDEGSVPEDLYLSTSLTIETTNNRLSEENSLAASLLVSESLNETEIKSNIENSYQDIWNLLPIKYEDWATIHKGNIFDPSTQTNLPNTEFLDPDDIWANTLTRYAIRAGIPFTIKKISKGISQTNPNRFGWNDIKSTVVVDIEIPYIQIFSNSPIVQLIKSDLEDSKIDLAFNKFYTGNIIRRLRTSDIAPEDDDVERDYIAWEDRAELNDIRFESLWVNTGSRGWCIKADAVNNPALYGFKYSEINTYLLSILDTGYKKKKIPWYKKAIAVIAFIVAIVFSPYTAGQSLTLLGVAKAIIVASLLLAIITLAFSVLGMTEWASAFAAASEFVDPLVTVASIIVLIDIASSLAEKIADEGLTTVVENSISDFAENLIDSIIQGATDLASGTISSASMQFTANLVSLYTLPDKNKLKSLNARNKDLKIEYEQLSEELDQERDALRGFMNIYAKPATADWSLFSSQFDLPYERGGGPLSTGNIQRTTKQALRKGTYNDPIFDNIRIKY